MIRQGLMSRLDLCQVIMSRANLRLNSVGFFPIFNKAINELAAIWQKDRRKDRPLFVARKKRLIEDSTMASEIVRAGKAINEPNTGARDWEVIKLWGENIPELHLKYPHQEQHRVEWSKYMGSKKAGYYWRAHILADLPSTELTSTQRDILTEFVPPGCRPEMKWQQNPKARLESFELFCQAHVARYFPRQAKSSITCERYLLAEEMDGSEITITAHAEAYVYWRVSSEPQATCHQLRMRVLQPSVPVGYGQDQTRLIRFHRHGIDITDSAGEVFRFARGPKISERATFDVAHFHLSLLDRNKTGLVEGLWERVTGLDYREAKAKAEGRLANSPAVKQKLELLPLVEPRKPLDTQYDVKKYGEGQPFFGPGEGWDAFFKIKYNYPPEASQVTPFDPVEAIMLTKFCSPKMLYGCCKSIWMHTISMLDSFE